jgi:predicted DNA-binding protein with PD1-like motif
MRYHLLDDGNGRRSFVLALEIGEEVVSTLTAFAQEQSLRASTITGIGAFQRSRLGFFDWDRREFHENKIDEQTEVLALTGNITDSEEGRAPHLHIHVVLGKKDASTAGGHLVEAIVRPTLELMINESPEHLRRAHDEKTGLVLLKP